MLIPEAVSIAQAMGAIVTGLNPGLAKKVGITRTLDGQER